jgi:hypothetical protein
MGTYDDVLSPYVEPEQPRSRPAAPPISGAYDDILAAPPPEPVAPSHEKPAGAPSSFGDRLQNLREGLQASTEGVIRGIPVLGPLLDRGVNAVAAAPAELTGNRDATFKALQDESTRIQTQHPIANTVGEVTGSLMSAVPAARAFPAAFGGATLPGQVAAGGVIGGADALTRSGGDLNAVPRGAIIGGAGPIMGSVLAPIGQGISSAARWINDKLPSAVTPFARKIAPMANEKIGEAAEQGYQTLSRDISYNPNTIDDLINMTRRDLHGMGRSDQIGATEALKTMETLRSLPPTPSSLHTVRKALDQITGGDEGHSARYARQMLDSLLEKPPASAIVTGAANAPEVYPRLMRANADYQASMQSRELRDRVAKAKLDASGALGGVPFLAEGQAVRKSVKNWMNSENQSRYVLPQQREALNEIVKPGSLGEGALRTAGALTGTGRVGALTGPSIAAIGFGTGGTGMLPSLAIGAGGAAASAAQTGLTRRAVNYADDIIRSASPSAQADMLRQLPPPVSMTPALANMPASISRRAYRDEISRLLAMQGERMTTPGPRRIIIDGSTQNE